MEAYQTLAPGGLVATRDADTATTMFLPKNEYVESARRAIERYSVNGGEHHEFGREHPEVLRRNGFELVSRSATFDCYADGKAETIVDYICCRLSQEYMKEFFENDDNQELLPGDRSRSIREQMEQMKKCIYTWGRDREAFVAVSRLEAIGKKPV